MNTFQKKIKQIHKKMIQNNINIVLLRSTNKYFNTYTHHYNNEVKYISGFKGSVADAIITNNKHFLFIDGRYHEQAKLEAPHFIIKLHKHKTIEQSWIYFLSQLSQTTYYSIFINMNHISHALNKQIRKIILLSNITITYANKNFININNVNKKSFNIYINKYNININDKFKYIYKYYNNKYFFLITKLDDISWITNLYSNQFNFDSTFISIALILYYKTIIGIKFLKHIPIIYSRTTIIRENVFFIFIKKLHSHINKITINPCITSQQVYLKIKKYNLKIKKSKNIIAYIKSIKNKKEIKYIRKSIQNTDKVMFETIQLIIKKINSNKNISEQIIFNILKKKFIKYKAYKLSFMPCCAANQHSAIIHYTTLSTNTIYNKTLFLIDAGASYKYKLATDLTRTFFISNHDTYPNIQYKKIYTIVLKASIAGLKAKIPINTAAKNLDIIIRHIIKKCGFNYNHSSGHGIGIHVHESIPNISSNSNHILKLGNVFSIEPGIYIRHFIGIRLENIVYLKKDKNIKNYIKIYPLSFSPFDNKLINYNMLTVRESLFLKTFQKHYTQHKKNNKTIS